MHSACLLLALLLPGRADAHGMRTAYLEVEEQGEGRVSVRFRSTVRATGVQPEISGCTLTPLEGVTLDDTGHVRTFVGTCEGPLQEQQITVSGLGSRVTEAVVWFTPREGEARSKLLSSEDPSWTPSPGVPASAPEIAAQYVSLGAEHIAGGVDHLLFLLLLLLTAPGLRAALWAETAFSLSHGLSFAATSLGWLSVPAPAAEAAIALSLVMMALDVGREAPAPRQTALLALLFGAVHGLGFASGLTEVGLPAQHAAAALLGFGLGVELGQMAFVLLLFVLLQQMRRSALFPRLAIAIAQAGGALATCWLLQRLLLVFPHAPWRS
jgi:hypothetical protein